MSLRIRYVAAWIACFAILLAALAPAVSRVLSASRGMNPAGAETCAVSHVLPVADAAHMVHGADDAHAAHHSPAPAKKDITSAHCPFCLTHAGSFGLPPSAGLTLPRAAGMPAPPELFYLSPRPLFAWATPHSRAPPALS